MNEHENSSFQLGEAPSLQDWAKTPDIKTLKEDLEAARPSHTTQLADISRWRELLSVTGSAKPKAVRGRSSVQPKLIRRQNEWRYSALTEPFLGSEKLFEVTPRTWEDTAAAEQNELVINWQINTKFNKVKFIDEYVRTAADEGTCIVRTGWDRRTRMKKVQKPIYEYWPVSSQGELTAFQEIEQIAQSNWNAFLDLDPVTQEMYYASLEYDTPMMVRDTGETQEEEEEEVLVNQPTLQFVAPENFYVDPSCEGDLSKARFVVVSYETSKGELIRDPRFKNLEFVRFESNSPLSEPDHKTLTPDTFNFKDEMRKRVVAYEYWGLYDIHNDGVLVPILATWIGNTMVRLEENPFPDGKAPFVLVPYLPMKRKLWGETDAELLEDNQRVQGALMRGMIDLLARSANSQIGIQKGALDAVNKRRFDNGDDYEFNPTNNPHSVLVEHKYPELPNSALTMLTLQNQEAESLSGAKAFSGGLSGNAYGDVAAGIRGMLDAASKREMAILRRLAQGIQEIGNKLISMNQAFLSEEEVVRITNEQFVTVRREDLAGNFDLKVDISTAEVDNAKSQDLAFMLQTIGPHMDLSMQKLILGEIARLKRMPLLSKQIKDYAPQPDPLEEELKQMEIAKARKEIEKLDSEIQLNMARAEKERAIADASALDFVEKESGTTHARNLELQEAQAQANQDLAVTKAILDKRKEGEKPGDVAAAVGYNQLSRATTGGAPDLNPLTRVRRRPDPATNIGSAYFDPAMDRSMNPALNF